MPVECLVLWKEGRPPQSPPPLELSRVQSERSDRFSRKCLRNLTRPGPCCKLTSFQSRSAPGRRRGSWCPARGLQSLLVSLLASSFSDKEVAQAEPAPGLPLRPSPPLSLICQALFKGFICIHCRSTKISFCVYVYLSLTVSVSGISVVVEGFGTRKLCTFNYVSAFS